MIVTKTFRYRVYSTPEQAVLLAKHFGAKRFVFNYFLDGNAAGNIFDEGLRIHCGSGSESQLKQKREEASTLVESMSHETQPSLAVG